MVEPVNGIHRVLDQPSVGRIDARLRAYRAKNGAGVLARSHRRLRRHCLNLWVVANAPTEHADKLPNAELSRSIAEDFIGQREKSRLSDGVCPVAPTCRGR
jgi:hypothetical protein